MNKAARRIGNLAFTGFARNGNLHGNVHVLAAQVNRKFKPFAVQSPFLPQGILLRCQHSSSNNNGSANDSVRANANANANANIKGVDEKAAEEFVSEDLTANHERQAETTDKLRDILNNIGMSISQWKIRDAASSISSNSRDNRRARRRRTNRENETSDRAPHENPYLYSHPRRMAEQFDAYNIGPYSARRRNYLSGDDISARLRVKSVHAASSIDITKVLTAAFGPSSKTPAIRHMFGRTSVIIQLPPTVKVKDDDEDPDHDNDHNHDNENENDAAEPASSNSADEFFHSEPMPRYVAIFRFGSIVFFNVSPKDASFIQDKVKKYSVDPVARGFQRKEHFEIAISPKMESIAHVNADFATVKELDINSVAIISRIMGQTVAFDSYNDTVDELLATFASINSKVKKTGKFSAMQTESLFKVVAQNNSLFIDMIAKLGIKDRSDTAWNLSQYERLYDGMKHEFEIEPRFEHIEFKLNLIQQNAKFFLEILHNQKSSTLEWIIIILITFECGLMLMEMSGIGPSLLKHGDALAMVKSLPPP